MRRAGASGEPSGFRGGVTGVGDSVWPQSTGLSPEEEERSGVLRQPSREPADPSATFALAGRQGARPARPAVPGEQVGAGQAGRAVPGRPLDLHVAFLPALPCVQATSKLAGQHTVRGWGAQGCPPAVLTPLHPSVCPHSSPGSGQGALGLLAGCAWGERPGAPRPGLGGAPSGAVAVMLSPHCQREAGGPGFEPSSALGALELGGCFSDPQFPQL